MKRIITGLLLLAVLALLAGCVSKDTFEKVQQDLLTAEETVSDQQAQIAELINELDRADEALGTEQGRSAELASSLEQAGAELEETQTTLASTEVTLADTQGVVEDARTQLADARERLIGFDELKSLFHALVGTFEKSTDTMWHAPADGHNTRLWVIAVSDYYRSAWTALGNLGFNAGLLARQNFTHLYSQFPRHWSDMKQANTVLIYQPSLAPWSALATLPTQYESLFPFSVSFLQQQSVPFAFLEKDATSGLIRAVIVAERDVDFIDLITKMFTREVLIGVPWTVN